MVTQVFTPQFVHEKPIIYLLWDGTEQKKPGFNINDTSYHAAGLCVDPHICHLWQRQTDTIIDFRVTDTDSKSYISHPLDNVLEIHEK